jgi:hypothetical protein
MSIGHPDGKVQLSEMGLIPFFRFATFFRFAIWFDSVVVGLSCCTAGCASLYLLQDKHGIGAGEAARYIAIEFSVQSLAAVLSQLVVVQGLRPAARRTIDA